MRADRRPGVEPARRAGELEELAALNARFIRNYVTNDVPSHDAILHADFICIDPDGSRIGRAEYLRRWATGFDPAAIPYYDMRDELITVVDNTALVRATNRHVVRRDGCETVGMTAYIDTYVRAGDGWLCLQAQLTTVAPQAYPGDDTVMVRYVGGEEQRL